MPSCLCRHELNFKHTKLMQQMEMAQRDEARQERDYESRWRRLEVRFGRPLVHVMYVCHGTTTPVRHAPGTACEERVSCPNFKI